MISWHIQGAIRGHTEVIDSEKTEVKPWSELQDAKNEALGVFLFIELAK